MKAPLPVLTSSSTASGEMASFLHMMLLAMSAGLSTEPLVSRRP
jgi:hypothetical protein